MLKRLLSPLAGVLVAGSVFSQDTFSFYFPTNKDVSTSIVFSSKDDSCYNKIYENIDFNRSKESFVDTYVRVLDDKVSTSKANIYRTLANGGDYNIQRTMARTLADTVMERYEIAIEIKKFAEDLRKKSTLERSMGSSVSKNVSGERPYKLILRPSVRGITQNNVGVEFVLKDENRDNLALTRFYWNRAELRVPLGNVFDVREKQSWFNSFLKKVSLSARARYDDEINSSVILSYESPWN